VYFFKFDLHLYSYLVNIACNMMRKIWLTFRRL
jgi:hypothetical protein